MKRPTAGDALGGLAASTILLPQALAFGAALGADLGAGTAAGAMAGLIAAVAVSLVSGLVGGTNGLVSAPNGPTFALLSGAVVALAAAGVSGAPALAAVAVILVVAGLAQVILGVARGGDLVKFVPYPVVAGFMTGSAILMIRSQLAPLSGPGADGGWSSWRWLPAVTAAVTFAAIAVVPRLVPRIPGPLAGLAVGTAAFHALAALGPGPVPESWVVGALPHLDSLSPGLKGASLAALPWTLLVLQGLALALLAALNTLLASVVADSLTGSRHDSRRQLVGQGFGLVLSGVLGGIAASGTTGASVVAVRGGGRRFAALFTAVILVTLVLFASPVTAALPLSVLAGVILHVALVGTVERDVIAWALRPRSRIDAVLAVIVTVVTVARDLMSAVGLGVAIAIVQFVREQVRAPVIHRRSTIAQRPSLRRRTQAERKLLAAHADRVVLYELKGSLFFGTADRLDAQVAADLERRVRVVLDLGHVRQVDTTAVRVFRQMAMRLRARGGELMFSEVHGALGLGQDVERALRESSLAADGVSMRTFVDADEALEACEDALLLELGHPRHDPSAPLALAATEIGRRLTPSGLPALEAACTRRSVPAGETLLHAGTDGHELFIVLAGRVDARLPTTAHHYLRLASFGPGTFFGEVAFVGAGVRTADVVVVHDAELLVLDRPALERLASTSPSTAMQLLDALAHELAAHLAWADAEMRRLAG